MKNAYFFSFLGTYMILIKSNCEYLVFSIYAGAQLCTYVKLVIFSTILTQKVEINFF